MAGFPVSDERPAVPAAIHFVPNLVHHVSEYVNGFRDAGLEILGCQEVPFTDSALESLPTYAALPDASRQAYADLPFLLVCEVSKPA
jgi:hypothetical protein